MQAEPTSTVLGGVLLRSSSIGTIMGGVADDPRFAVHVVGELWEEGGEAIALCALATGSPERLHRPGLGPRHQLLEYPVASIGPS